MTGGTDRRRTHLFYLPFWRTNRTLIELAQSKGGALQRPDRLMASQWPNIPFTTWVDMPQ